MACTLSVNFSTPGYGTGSEIINYSVPDGSYRVAYKVVISGAPNNTYQVRVDGDGGTITLATYSPGNIVVNITSSSNSCANIIKYDCINGACLTKTTYNTPGFYASLSACETACGIGCSGKCLSNDEWSQIEGLSNKLKNKNC